MNIKDVLLPKSKSCLNAFLAPGYQLDQLPINTEITIVQTAQLKHHM
jgi:hypothetical protein